ncbi:MAG TPA: PspA/IM30 family protein [Polyangium sp.]|nr:PspA/IM30 family protein [Polyangium sp.]
MLSPNARQALQDVLDVVHERADTLLHEAHSARELADDIAGYAFRRIREKYFGIPADPVIALLDTFILELGNDFIELKKDTAMAIADEKRLVREVELESQKLLDWEKCVLAATQANDELLQQEALSRKQEHAELVAALHAQWKKQSALTSELKAILIRTNQVIEKMKRVRRRLCTRGFLARANDLKKQADRMEQLVKSLSLLADFDGVSNPVEQPMREDEGR